MAIGKIKSMEKDVPAIILANDRDPGSITEGLKLGARDVALDDDDERLVLIIERELDNLEVRRAKRRADVELRESDRRNQLLLASSNAPIGYVHEGMHIYTNQAYADMFGYEDADEFARIPIIDLIASADQEKFKDFLKSRDEHNEDSEEFNCVDSAGTVIQARLSLSPAFTMTSTAPRSFSGGMSMIIIWKTESKKYPVRICSQACLTAST